MPRNMSFSMTTEQILNRTKTVTRRLQWKKLKPGTILNACEKCQGLKLGEKVNKLCQIRVVSVTQEPLNTITQEECIKEGFPDLKPAEFIQMFINAHRSAGLSRIDEVTRIEFEYLDITQV